MALAAVCSCLSEWQIKEEQIKAQQENAKENGQHGQDLQATATSQAGMGQEG